MQIPSSRLIASVALALTGLLAQPAPATAEEGRYAADLAIGALCPEGAFPIDIEDAAGTLSGTLTLALQPSGDVTGSLAIDGATHTVAGKHKVRWWGQKLIVKGGSGRRRFKFSGRVVDGIASGRFRDGGTVVKGRPSATVDLSAAAPMRVSFDVVLEPDVGRWFDGTGTGAVCADSFAVAARLRKSQSSDKLWVEGPALRWRSRGVVSGDTFVAARWKLISHGIRLDGRAVTLSFTPPGIPDVLLLTVGGHAFPLPPPTDYLGDEYGPALLAEIRAAGLTAAEEDFVDAASTTDGNGLAGLVATMEWTRDNWVTGQATPTSVVIVAHSHGGTWAHEAIRLVPDLPVAALIDLDTNSCGWRFVHSVDGANPFDPVAAHVIGEAAYDVEDVVWPNVAAGLEIWSVDDCIDPFASERFDDRQNIRSNGTLDGLEVYDSTDDHSGVRNPAGDAYPVVRDWLLDVLSGL